MFVIFLFSEKIQLLPEAQLCFETCSPENQESYG